MPIVRMKFTVVPTIYSHEFLTATGEILFVSRDNVSIPVMLTEQGIHIEVEDMNDLHKIGKGDRFTVDDLGRIVKYSAPTRQ